MSVPEKERGSATIELAIIAPALLALLSLVVIAGRVSLAGGAVEQAAASASRAASLARDARTARADARAAASAVLADQGMTCRQLLVSVDTAGFARALATPGSVTVDVRCTVPFAELSVPGMPGSRVVTARMVSPIDRFRAGS